MTLNTILNKTAADGSGQPYQFVNLAGEYDAFWMVGDAYGGAADAVLNRAAATGTLTPEGSTEILQTGTRTGYARGFETPYTMAQMMSADAVTMVAHFVPDPSADQQIIGNLAVGQYYVTITQNSDGVAATFNAPLVQAAVTWAQMPDGATEPVFVIAQFSPTTAKVAVWRPGWSAPLTDQKTITGSWPSSEPVRIGSSSYNMFAGRPLVRMAGFRKALSDDAKVLSRFKRLESLAFAHGIGTRAAA